MATQRPVHETARLGFNTETGPALYDRARPSFPEASMTSILESGLRASGGQPLRVMEFGAGTGISTRAFLDIVAARNKTGEDESAPVQVSKLLIYEPSPGMRASFDKALQAKSTEYLDAKVFTDGLDSVSVQDGTFEQFPLASQDEGTVDIILIAQAWHWAQDHEVALSNFARALKPNGCLALIWNLEDREAAPWVARLRDAYEQHERGSPQYRHGLWKKMYDTKAYSQYFNALPQEDFSRILPTTKEGAWDRVASKSYISILGKEQLAELRQEYEKIIANGDANGRRWIDQEQGIFEYVRAARIAVLDEQMAQIFVLLFINLQPYVTSRCS
ncbi:hypothetical protein V8E36_002967 [Tilletia maclaganii]